jgi:hypothetical protein
VKISRAPSFGVLILEHFEQLSHEQLLLFDIYEVLVALVFIAEFVFEWYHAKNRRLYIRRNWFYLLAAVPIPTQTFELLRGIRVLRLLKLLEVFAHLRYENNTKLFAD